MPFNQVDLSLPPDFSGVVRLFPLPNLVVFPGVMQGLHIFEPQYIQMMRDAVASDQLITMAAMKPGWESDEKKPAVFPTVCIGKIVTHALMEDGRYNLLLVGAKRATIIEELTADTLYRQASVELIEETCSREDEFVDTLKQKLIEAFRIFVKLHPGFGENSLSKSLETLPPGLMADLICYSAGLDAEQQMRVLETPDIVMRLGAAIGFLEQRNELTRQEIDREPNFPPDFSAN